MNQRLFIHKFVTIQKCCFHPPGQYLLQRLCFLCHHGQTFLRLSNCFLFLLIFRYTPIYYARVKTEKQLYYHKDWEVSIMFYYLF